MRSPENGGPEMLNELAYRLIVEHPFIQNIRNNVITLITPVVEVRHRARTSTTPALTTRRARKATRRCR